MRSNKSGQHQPAPEFAGAGVWASAGAVGAGTAFGRGLSGRRRPGWWSEWGGQRVRIVERVIAGVSRCRYQQRIFVAPSCPGEQRALEPGDGEVHDGEQVHVVAADCPVDEILAEGKNRQVRQRNVDVGSRRLRAPARWVEICEIRDQVGLRVVDDGDVVSLNVRMLSNAVVNCGRCAISTSSAGGISARARRMTSRWSLSVPARRLSASMEATTSLRWPSNTPTNVSRRVSRLRASDSLPFSAALKLWMMSPIWPRPPELTTVDNVESVRSVDGNVGGLSQRDGGSRLQPPLRWLSERGVERDVHRAEQARLADSCDDVGRDDDAGLQRDLDIGMPVVDRHLGDAADDDVVDHHRANSDSKVPTLAISTW